MQKYILHDELKGDIESNHAQKFTDEFCLHSLDVNDDHEQHNYYGHRCAMDFLGVRSALFCPVLHYTNRVIYACYHHDR